MVTPLKKTALHELISKPVLFDANIFMVGISERISDERYSFENMKQLYIIPLFESFTNIYIHEEVYKELDDKNRTFVDMYKEKNVSIVGEDDFFCSKEIMVDIVAGELNDLKDVDIITFDVILLQAYVYYAKQNNSTNSKGLKAIYKKYCADVIKRHGLPKTLGEYIKASQRYL
ncbi:MAG: hypothetical protein MRZ84_05765 [Eubacterium sp.]|nr:hypothetical protein [Eubacterium sp.]